MKVIRIRENIMTDGLVETYNLSCGEKIPAVIIGESGRGRSLGIVPVALKKENYEQWKKEGRVYIKNATVGQTKTERPKLIETVDETTDKIIAIFITPIGFRGSNYHEFPEGTEILASGTIAQGDAGRMGSGNEYVVVRPVPSAVKVHIGGRRYGAPTDYVYHFTEKEFFVRTGEEENLVDGVVEEFVTD